MEKVEDGQALETRLLEILRRESPLALNVLLDRLNVSQFDTHVRDLIWQLIDQGKIRLTDERQLEFLGQ
ncbi:MAG: hypothetical protein U0694_03155 [Anaerolineae bacterium]